MMNEISVNEFNLCNEREIMFLNRFDLKLRPWHWNDRSEEFRQRKAFFLVINSSVGFFRVCRIFHKIRFVSLFTATATHSNCLSLLETISKNRILAFNSPTIPYKQKTSFSFVFKFNFFFIFFHTSSAQNIQRLQFMSIKEILHNFIFARCAIAVLCLVGVVFDGTFMACWWISKFFVSKSLIFSIRCMAKQSSDEFLTKRNHWKQTWVEGKVIWVFYDRFPSS